MFTIASRFPTSRPNARWFVVASAAALFSAAALTACGPRDVQTNAANTPSAAADRAGTPVPPAPVAALAPAAAVAPPPTVLAQPVPPAPAPPTAVPAPPSAGYAAAPTPQPVPVANSDDRARSDPAATRNARTAHRQAAPAGQLGSVDRIEPIHQRPQGTGAGAVIGGVAGGLLGNQFGHGLGRAAMTGLGAAGGAIAGNNVERNVRKTVVGYRVHVRLDDGTTRAFERSHVGDLHVGDRVRVGRDGVRRA